MTSAQRRRRSTRWPQVESEPLVWLVSEGGDASRSSNDRTYASAIVAEIGHEDMYLPSDCALISEDVRAAIAAFDQRVGDALVPLEALLVRVEASASSRIENVAAPVPDLMLAESGDDGGRSADDVLGNVDATTAAIVLSEEITPDTILDIHRALLSTTHPVLAGRWRTDPVWIGSYSGGPPEATYVPPAARRIPAAIDDLCDFVNRTDLPAFVHAMVAHAQFETIHPFPDGNGRVGRALIHALLRREGLTVSATLPISAGIVSQKHRYVEALTSYRDGDFVPIVELGADATFAALRSASWLADDVARLTDDWSDMLSSTRSTAVVHRVVPLLLSHPVVDRHSLSELTGASVASVGQAIRQLEEFGVLSPAPAAGSSPDSARRRRLVAQGVVRALNSFTSRSINPFGRH